METMKENEIVLYQPDETVKLEVRIENETVWLNQAQMAVLFGTKRQAITKHIKNIFDWAPFWVWGESALTSLGANIPS